MAPRPGPVNPAHFVMCLRSLDPKTIKIMLAASIFVALCFGIPCFIQGSLDSESAEKIYVLFLPINCNDKILLV